MKTILLRTITFWAAVLYAGAVVCQTDQIQNLEGNLPNVFGSARVELLVQLSDAYLQAGRPEKAGEAAESATEYARRIKNQELRALALNQEGKVMVSRGKKKAIAKFEQSVEILRESNIGNKTLLINNLENIRSIMVQTGKIKEAGEIEGQIAQVRQNGPAAANKQALQEELSTMQKQMVEKQQDFQKNQSKLLEQSQELQQQLAAREEEINRMSQEQMKTAMLVMQQRVLLDSVYYRAGLDSLTVANANLALREAESNRKFHFTVIGILLLLAGGALFSYVRARQNAKILEEKNKTIREEQQRSDNLLLNILPSLVAEELKKKGRTQAQYFDDVSVLFADFVGFSKIAEKLSPQQLVNELDTCFQQFDAIIARHGLEKIKTIGDAYMCAGGLPNGGGSQMKNILWAAIEMQQWLAHWNDVREKAGLPRFDARIGIHRGPVVAGVVGSKKFAFDIWGDTVNIAARVEQAGEGGRINLSGAAYAAIKSEFNCQYRGKISAKNKGEIDMYFVEQPPSAA